MNGLQGELADLLARGETLDLPPRSCRFGAADVSAPLLSGFSGLKSALTVTAGAGPRVLRLPVRRHPEDVTTTRSAVGDDRRCWRRRGTLRA